MAGEIQELQAIHMSVQTADLNMIGFSCEETITLSCGLMNIGRGICSVTIKPSISRIPKHSGSLYIEISRPYMKANIDLGLEEFLKTKELLLRTAVRPATLVLLLDKSLRVNLKGDLLIEKETNIASIRTARIGNNDAIVTTPNPERDESPLPAAFAMPIPNESTSGTVTGPVVTAPQSQASPRILFKLGSNHAYIVSITTGKRAA